MGMHCHDGTSSIIACTSDPAMPLPASTTRVNGCGSRDETGQSSDVLIEKRCLYTLAGCGRQLCKVSAVNQLLDLAQTRILADR